MKGMTWVAVLIALALVLGACQPTATPGGGTTPGAATQAAGPTPTKCGSPPPTAAPTATAGPTAEPPTAAPTPEGSRWDAIQQRGKVIIGVKYDVKGFGYLNPETNKLEGLDVDMGHAIAEAILGDPEAVEFKEAISRNRIPFLQDGTVDLIISTMTINADRVKVVDFAEVYYVAGQSLLVPLDSTIQSLKDVACKKVGTVTGSTSELNIRKLAPEAEVLLFDTYSDAVAAMAAGQVDAVSTDDAILYGFKNANPEKWNVVGGQFTVEPYGIAVRKGESQLLEAINGVVRAMKSDGRWKAIYEKHISSPAPEPPPANWEDVKLPTQ